MSSPQFTIEQKLSESATTVVYRAFDTVLHRTVLLKVLHPHLANDKELNGRFVREARACAALRSEHIVQIYDLTEYEGAPAIVMEYVEGRSLKEVIASGENRTKEFAVTVAQHVLRALSIAHERGIIHRDIKPGNILVSSSGLVKVTDFGLAYVSLSPTMTMEGMVLGTPAYMAPEQVRGDEVDHRTDLFALGLTVVETLTGERMFEGSTYSECMKKVLAFTVKDLERYNNAVSLEFAAFLASLLHPSKEERCASAKDALLLLGEKIEPAAAAEGTPPAVKRSRSHVMFGIVSALLVIVLLFGWNMLTAPIEPVKSEESNVETALSVTVPDTVPSGSVVIPDRVPVEPQRAADRASAPLDAPAVKDSGRLYATSSPWAKVYVNNMLIGETPLSAAVPLAAGTYTVMFANPSFDPIVRTVVVESGKEVTVNGDFIGTAGYLQCVVKPWAEVFVNELYKDTTPLSKPLMLSPGKYTVRLHNSAFPDIIREVTVRSKDTTTLTVSFTP